MGRVIDLTGQRFGMLQVISRGKDHISPSGQRKIMWLCQCDCGNTCTIQSANLRNEHSKSCGCLKVENARKIGKKHNTKHNKSHTKLYIIWKGIKQRCLNPNHRFYNRYGGRGISVCKEWLTDFQVFYDWSMEHGYQEGLSIDRIDNEKGYFPNNCRWVTAKMQTNNRSSNRHIQINGVTKTLAEWCDQYGILGAMVSYRLSHGWTPEEALGVVPRNK